MTLGLSRFRTCLAYLGMASQVAAIGLALTPGLEEFVPAPEAVSVVAGYLDTALDVINLFDQSQRKGNNLSRNLVGIAIDLGSLGFSYGGGKLVNYGLTSNTARALRVAKATGAPEATIELLTNELEDAMKLAEKVKAAFVSGHGLIIDYTNERLAESGDAGTTEGNTTSPSNNVGATGPGGVATTLTSPSPPPLLRFHLSMVLLLVPRDHKSAR